MLITTFIINANLVIQPYLTEQQIANIQEPDSLINRGPYVIHFGPEKLNSVDLFSSRKGFGLRAFGHKSLTPIYSCLAYVSATFIATFLVPKELSYISRFLERTKDYSIQMISVLVRENFAEKLRLELTIWVFLLFQ